MRAMPTAERRRMSTEQRRAQLLARGSELLAQRPYDEVSIDEIATAAGVSKGLLYHYFPSKRDFVVAALREHVERVTRLTAPDPGLGPVEQIEAGLDAFLDYVEAHAGGYATLFRTRGGGDERIRAVLEQARERRIAVVLEGIGGWLADPGAASHSPALRAAVQGWIFFVEGAVLRWLDHGDLDRAELRELLTSVLLDALRAAARLDPALAVAAPAPTATAAPTAAPAPTATEPFSPL
jgi:AcrR family transcriptional regulator